MKLARVTLFSAMLTDNIFTSNTSLPSKNGLIVTDILQHFPIFSFVSNYCDGPLENKKVVFLRDRSANKREKLNNALHNTDTYLVSHYFTCTIL